MVDCVYMLLFKYFNVYVQSSIELLYTINHYYYYYYCTKLM